MPISQLSVLAQLGVVLLCELTYGTPVELRQLRLIRDSQLLRLQSIDELAKGDRARIVERRAYSELVHWTYRQLIQDRAMTRGDKAHSVIDDLRSLLKKLVQ